MTYETEKSAIKALIKKASESDRSEDAMRYSQAATNSSQALYSLRDADGKPAVDLEEAVNRFLQWRLPANFSPDAGISFKADFNENTAHPMKHEPVGTNLFDAVQTRDMLKYVLGLN